MKIQFNNAFIELDVDTVENLLKDIAAEIGDDGDEKYYELVKHEPRNWEESPLEGSLVEDVFHALEVESAHTCFLGQLMLFEEGARYVTKEMVEEIVKSDDIAMLGCFILGSKYMQHIEGIDETLEQLSQHREAEVRCAFAQNDEMSLQIIRKLAKDSDVTVREAAIENLELRYEVDE
jgi:hypothetical protein